MKVKAFLEKNRVIIQLIYGVFLIILIPVLIVSNAYFIIQKYNRGLDTAIQREAYTLEKTVYTLIRDDLEDDNILQQKITAVSKNNSEIMELAVLKPADNGFTVVASSRTDDIGQARQFYFYNLAWNSPDNEGLATDSMRLAGTPEGEALTGGFEKEDRFWLAAIPMSDTAGTRRALLTMKMSSQIIDSLTRENFYSSFLRLLITVGVVILFLLAAVRLWDYALLYRRIKEVDQMKDDFISMTSHELRTPVTGIRGYVSLILDGSFGEINDKVADSLKLVQSTTNRLSAMVEDLLNVSRIERGRMKIELSPQDPGSVISDTVAELRVQADEKKLALEYQPHIDQLPSANIDKDKFKQVLVNLVGNAIKYTQQGSVKIITAIEKNVLEIRIKDTGIGMTAEERKHLFEKFYRIKNDQTEKITGTGLGLWITKQLVELMGGRITVDSIKGTGTQVTLKFPIV